MPSSPVGRSSRPRTLLAVVGVLLLQAAFIASYVGGLHGPSAHQVPVAVVAPPAQVARIASSLGPAAAEKVDLRSVGSLRQARSDIVDRTAYGAYVPAPDGDRLLVASARGLATTDVLRGVFGPLAGGPLQVSDVAPLAPEDARGLTAFYLVIGWIVGGYLVASIIGLYRGMAPAGPRDALLRLALLAVYAALSGATGVLIVQTGYGYLPGSRLAVFGIGTLLVLAVAAATAALETVAGILGTGLAVVLFVVLGNPSAGGPWSIPLTAWPWRLLGPWLPNGAATTAVTQAAYFDVRAVTVPLLVLAGWAALGALVTWAVSLRRRPFLDLPGH